MTQEHLVDDPELHAAAAGLVSLLGPQARSSLEHHIDLTNAREVDQNGLSSGAKHGLMSEW